MKFQHNSFSNPICVTVAFQVYSSCYTSTMFFLYQLYSCDWSNYCHYDGRNGSCNHNSWVNPMCDRTITRHKLSLFEVICPKVQSSHIWINVISGNNQAYSVLQLWKWKKQRFFLETKRNNDLRCYKSKCIFFQLRTLHTIVDFLSLHLKTHTWNPIFSLMQWKWSWRIYSPQL